LKVKRIVPNFETKDIK